MILCAWLDSEMILCAWLDSEIILCAWLDSEMILCAWLDSEVQELANSHRVVTCSLKLVPSVENPELTHVLPVKPGVCQNIAMDASPTAGNFCLVFIF